MRRKTILCIVTLMATPHGCKKSNVSESSPQAGGVGGVQPRSFQRIQGPESVTYSPSSRVNIGGPGVATKSTAHKAASTPASSPVSLSAQDYTATLNAYGGGTAKGIKAPMSLNSAHSQASSSTKTSPEFQRCIELGKEIDHLSLASTTFAATHEEMARVQPHIEARKKLVAERKSLFNRLGNHEKIKLAGRDSIKSLGHSMVFGSLTGAAFGTMLGAMFGFKVLFDPNVSAEKKLLGLLGFPVAGLVGGGVLGSVAVPGAAVMIGYAAIHKILEKSGFLPGGKHYASLKSDQLKIADSFYVTQSLWETPVTELTGTGTAPTSQELQNILNILNNKSQ